MCEHDFKPLKIRKNGKRVHACQECGALKIGEDTVVVDEDYLDLASLTSDPTLAEGRFWWREDMKQMRYSPDGAKVEIVYPHFDVLGRGKRLVRSAPAGSSMTFTVYLGAKTGWIRQFSTETCRNKINQFHTSYAHWTSQNTGVSVHNKAGLVYGVGETITVSKIPTRDKILAPDFPGRNADGVAWDGKYVYGLSFGSATGRPPCWVYKYDEEGSLLEKFEAPFAYGQGMTYDGQYFWTSHGIGPHILAIYQYSDIRAGTVIESFPTPASDTDDITWDGEYIHFLSGDSQTIYKLTPTGTVKDRIGPLPTAEGEGLTWDGTYLWYDDEATRHAYQLKTDGTQVRAFQPEGLYRPGGMAWDGHHLWIGNYGPSPEPAPDWIYKIGNTEALDFNYKITA